MKKQKKFYKNIKTDPVWGSEKFKKFIYQHYLQQKPANQDIPGIRIITKKIVPTVAAVIAMVAKFYKIDITDIKLYRRGKPNKPRTIAIYRATQSCQKTLEEIANNFGMFTRSGAGNAYHLISNRLKRKEETILRQEVEGIQRIISELGYRKT